MNGSRMQQRQRVIIKVHWNQFGRRKVYDMLINDKIYDQLLKRCKSYQLQKSSNRKQFKLVTLDTKQVINNLQDLKRVVPKHLSQAKTFIDQYTSTPIYTLNIQAVTLPSYNRNRQSNSQLQIVDKNSEVQSYDAGSIHNNTQLNSTYRREAERSSESSSHARNSLPLVDVSTLGKQKKQPKINIAQGIKCGNCDRQSFKGPVYQCSHRLCRQPCSICPACINKDNSKCKNKGFLRLCDQCQYKHHKKPMCSTHALTKIVSKQQLQHQNFILKPSSLKQPQYQQSIFEIGQLKLPGTKGRRPSKEEDPRAQINISSNFRPSDRSEVNRPAMGSSGSNSNEQNSRLISGSNSTVSNSRKKGPSLSSEIISKYKLSQEEVTKYKRIMAIFSIKDQEEIEPFLKQPYRQMSFQKLQKEIQAKRE